jgi:1,4-dihydroxy-2-naphthoate octaprenyltransferase
MNIKDAVRLYITISRWEFLPAVFIGIFIGILIGADSISAIIDSLPYLIEGLVIFILLFNVGFMVNCWADWQVDELYKTKLYHAVMKVGRRTVGLLVVLHIVVAFVLALHLSIVLHRIEISFLVWIGTFFGVAYSVEPFRFKRRGLLHSTVALPIFLIPGIYSYFLVSKLTLSAFYSQMFLLAAAGITVGHYALILVSQAEDLPADREMKLVTPAVRWGVHRTVVNSLGLNLFGSVLIVIGLAGLFIVTDPWLLALLPIVAISRFFSLREVAALAKRTTLVPEEGAYIIELREKMRTYPLWHAYGLSGIMISGICILVVHSLNLA